MKFQSDTDGQLKTQDCHFYLTVSTMLVTYRVLFLEPPPSLNMMEWLRAGRRKKLGKSEPETSPSATSALGVALTVKQCISYTTV